VPAWTEIVAIVAGQAGAVRGMRVVTGEVHSRQWHERGESGEEVQGFPHNVGGTSSADNARRRTNAGHSFESLRLTVTLTLRGVARH
jgi:hypothetical protein